MRSTGSSAAQRIGGSRSHLTPTSAPQSSAEHGIPRTGPKVPLPSSSHATLPAGVTPAAGRRTVHVLVALEHPPPVACEQRHVDAVADGRLRCADGGQAEIVDHPQRLAVDAGPGAFSGQDGTAEVAHGLGDSSPRAGGVLLGTASKPVAYGPHRSRGAGFERHGGAHGESLEPAVRPPGVTGHCCMSAMMFSPPTAGQPISGRRRSAPLGSDER